MGPKGAMPPKFLAYLVVLCFERRCLTLNIVVRLKSKIFGTSQSPELAKLTTRKQQSGFTVLRI